MIESKMGGGERGRKYICRERGRREDVCQRYIEREGDKLGGVEKERVVGR